MYSKKDIQLLPVLAKALELEYGECSHFHYGLYESPEQPKQADDDFLAAQKRLSELLGSLVAESLAPDSSVLLCGASLESVAAGLPTPNVIFDPLPNPQSRDAHFETIVYEGTYNYLDQLEILTKARECLKSGGSLIFLGEFLEDDSLFQKSSLANLSSLLQLSERLGFELESELGLTESALKSWQHCRVLLNKFAETKEANDQEIAHCFNEIDEIVAEFESGRRCYRLFKFSKASAPKGEYALAEYGDIDSFDPQELGKLFYESFDTEFNSALWDWKYTQGAGKCVVARTEKGGEIVAHYGGAPRSIFYYGEPAKAIQVCDVMVLPEIRRHYGKSSLFFKTAATFLEREIGNTVNHLLGFGFPNQKAMNIAIRLGLYEKTDDLVEVVYPAPVLAQDSDAEPSSLILEPLETISDQNQTELESLWSEMKAEFGEDIIGVRDTPYFKYRYIDHPYAKEGRYHRVLIRDAISKRALALAVLKDHQQHKLIMDIVGSLNHLPLVLSFLNQQLIDPVKESRLSMWVTKNWADKIMLEAAIVNDLGIEIPCNSWNPGPSGDSLYGHWWLSAGDMDFM